MMKNVYIIVCLTAAFFLGACGATDSPEYDKSLAPANSAKGITPVTLADTLLSEEAAPKAAVQAVTTQPAASPAAAGLNPAHGQPKHRCDIAVGAPLNSPPAGNPNQQPAANKPVVGVQAPAAGNNAGLNPAHGQPGHDCAIAVGAPLKN
jgi:hypothetical protein